MADDATKQFKGVRKSPQKHLRSKQRNQVRREEKQKIHNERLAVRAKLSPQEQLERLDWRLGKDVGAKKERLRLQQQIQK